MLRGLTCAAVIAATASALPVAPAWATAKIIHVPNALAAESLSAPPASEDDAAGLKRAPDARPHIWRLMPRAKPTDARTARPDAAPDATCVTSAGSGVVNDAGAFHGQRRLIFGGQFHFGKAAWDSSRFLPTAGWTENRSLWMAKPGG